MPHLLYILPPDLERWPGGDLRVREQIRGWNRMGWQVRLMRPPGARFDIDEIEDHTWTTSEENFWHRVGSVLGHRKGFQTVLQAIFVHRVKRFLGRSTVDLVYTHDVAIAGYLSRTQVPLILDLSLADGIIDHAHNRGLRRLVSSTNLRAMVTDSMGLRNRLLRGGFAESRIVVLPAAVDCETYSEFRTLAGARRKTIFPQGVTVLLASGSLRLDPGVMCMVDLVKRFEDVVVALIFGQDDELTRIRNVVFARDLERVILLGNIPPEDLPAYRRAADILVIPHARVEHLNLTEIYHHMAARRPIVATDLAPIREVLDHEKTALLVPPNDPRAMAAAIRRLLEEPALARRLARAAFEKARVWTWEKRAEQVLQRVFSAERS